MNLRLESKGQCQLFLLHFVHEFVRGKKNAEQEITLNSCKIIPGKWYRLSLWARQCFKSLTVSHLILTTTLRSSTAAIPQIRKLQVEGKKLSHRSKSLNKPAAEPGLDSGSLAPQPVFLITQPNCTAFLESAASPIQPMGTLCPQKRLKCDPGRVARWAPTSPALQLGVTWTEKSLGSRPFSGLPQWGKQDFFSFVQMAFYVLQLDLLISLIYISPFWNVIQLRLLQLEERIFFRVENPTHA